MRIRGLELATMPAEKSCGQARWPIDAAPACIKLGALDTRANDGCAAGPHPGLSNLRSDGLQMRPPTRVSQTYSSLKDFACGYSAGGSTGIQVRAAHRQGGRTPSGRTAANAGLYRLSRNSPVVFSAQALG